MRLNRVSFFFSSVPNPNGIPRNRSRIFSRAADRLQWRRHLRWRQKKMRGSRRSITFFSVFFLERMEFFFKEKKGRPFKRNAEISLQSTGRYGRVDRLARDRVWLWRAGFPAGLAGGSGGRTGVGRCVCLLLVPRPVAGRLAWRPYFFCVCVYYLSSSFGSAFHFCGVEGGGGTEYFFCFCFFTKESSETK